MVFKRLIYCNNSRRDQLKIALLMGDANLYSYKRLLETARQRGHIVDGFDPAECVLVTGDGAPSLLCNGEPLGGYDAVALRIGAPIIDHTLAVLRQFELANVWALNDSASVGRSCNKWETLQILAEHGLSIPLSAFASNPHQAGAAIEAVNGAPIVIKTLQGKHGIGVLLAESAHSAQSQLEDLLRSGTEVCVQEFIAEAGGADIRCIVIGGKVAATMKRQSVDGDFRSNLHRGGRAEPVEITQEERNAAELAAKHLGLNFCGVDLLRSSRGPLVLEVNSSPGLEGIEAASGQDIAGKIIDYFEENAFNTEQ